MTWFGAVADVAMLVALIAVLIYQQVLRHAARDLRAAREGLDGVTTHLASLEKNLTAAMELCQHASQQLDALTRVQELGIERRRNLAETLERAYLDALRPHHLGCSENHEHASPACCARDCWCKAPDASAADG